MSSPPPLPFSDYNTRLVELRFLDTRCSLTHNRHVPPWGECSADYSLNVVNLWGGVGNAYLADIMPPEWRSIAFGINSSIYGVGKIIGPAIDLIPWAGSSASSINCELQTYAN